MKLSLKARQFSVYDDVLPDDACQRVWQYIQRENYQWVHAQLWHKAWRLSDGAPLTGPATFSDEPTARLANGLPLQPRAGETRPQFQLYPTGRHVDEIIGTLLQEDDGCRDLIGTRGNDWIGLTAKPFLYPQGAGQSWQQENQQITGSFAYFAHPQWNVAWGGEFMFGDDSLARANAESGSAVTSEVGASAHSPEVGQHLDNRRENEILGRVGMGYFIYPKPNRLIIASAAAPFAMNAVKSTAGDKAHCSISGFFIAMPGETGRRGT